MKRIITFSLSFIFFIISFSALGADFSYAPIPDKLKQEMIEQGLWKETCPVSLDRMSLLNISYYDFKGKIHDNGKMIVMDAAASYILDIFRELYDKNFPITKIKLTSEYAGDDDLSMADNNTSAFNCREVTGGGAVSIHAYGLAIDLNPVINPYLKPVDKEKGMAIILPPAGSDFLNRYNMRPGMAESVVWIFEKNGMPVWGGTWNDRIDWQHFQTSRTMAMLLAAMTPKHAKRMFELYVKYHKMLSSVSHAKEGLNLLALYKQDGSRFIQILSEYLEMLDLKTPRQAIKFIRKHMK